MSLQPDHQDLDREVLAVAPLDGFSLPEPGSRFALAPDLEIGGTPSFAQGPEATEILSSWDRTRAERATYALLHRPERFWQRGKLPLQMIQEQGIQEYMHLAILSLWLVRPDPFSSPFLLVFEPKRPEAWRVVLTERPIQHLSRGGEAHVEIEDLAVASRLVQTLANLRKPGAHRSVYIAVQFLWQALHERNLALRHATTWIALEALFGAEDAGETVYKLSHRIALFAAAEGESTLSICKDVKASYRLRSKVIHGSSGADSIGRASAIPFWTEELLRRCLLKILLDNNLAETFSSKEREEYLEGLVLLKDMPTKT